MGITKPFLKSKCLSYKGQLNIVLESVANVIKQEDIKHIGRKKNIKLSWFEDGMNFYIENPKKSIRTNKCSKVGGHRVNMHKSIVFLYAGNEY